MVGFTKEAREAAVKVKIENNKKRREQKELEYKLDPKLCKCCNKPLSFEQAKGKIDFCSIGCANKTRIRSKESREKTSNSAKLAAKSKVITNRQSRSTNCPICKNYYTPLRSTARDISYCGSDECRIKFLSDSGRRSIEKAMANGNFYGWKARTKEPSYPEKYFISLFENEQIAGYERELKVGRWFIDFAFTDKKIAIEIDGKQHKDRKHLDEQKDNFLIENGWKVFRIEWFNPVSEKNKERLYPQIEDMKRLLGV